MATPAMGEVTTTVNINVISLDRGTTRLTSSVNSTIRTKSEQSRSN